MAMEKIIKEIKESVLVGEIACEIETWAELKSYQFLSGWNFGPTVQLILD